MASDDADLVLFDCNNYKPILQKDIKSRCGWSRFEGWNLTVWFIIIIIGGQIVDEGGKFNTDVRGKALSYIQP